MRDLAFIGFIGALLSLGLRRPFIWVLAYAYVDIVSPHRLSYYLLNVVPLSMIVGALAVGGWLLFDRKQLRTAPRQWLIGLFVLWCGFTTLRADFPVEAAFKWDWAWKSMIWAAFLPFALRTRLRIESYLLFMVLGAAAIIVAGGIKTVLAGGGYGALNLMVDSNSGLYEGSTASTVAITIIPVILWLARHGTIFPKDWKVTVFSACLIFACLLIPVGTQARTGLVCIAVLMLLLLRNNKRRFLYLGFVGLALVASIPFLPQSFTSRMSTISTYQADNSAMTRIAVWGWTWNYVKENPLGGGFGAYRGNRIQVRMTSVSEGGGPVSTVSQDVVVDQARAYHSAYFEVLGEQGFFGLLLYLLIHAAGLWRMEAIRRRFRGDDSAENGWIAPLATALQHAHIIYLSGCLFLGIAYQPFIFMLLGVQIGLDLYLREWKRAPRRTFAKARPEPGSKPLAAG
ncbi:MAG: putative O-glycosylation ligase, exosortase A system-associated [Sphingomonadaceae bacterium]